MLKVLIVDDEPVITEGLKILVDWKAEGFDEPEVSDNALDALRKLRDHSYDLIITDIKMPTMSGLEFLEEVREKDLSDAYFIILSGFADFEYARRAIGLECIDYHLKPLEKKALLGSLDKVRQLHRQKKQELSTKESLHSAYLEARLASFLHYKYDDKDLEYIKSSLRFSKQLRYVSLQPISRSEEGDLDEELRELQRILYNSVEFYLGADKSYGIFDPSREENVYEIGLVLTDCLVEKRRLSTQQFLERLMLHLRGVTDKELVLLVGKNVSGLEELPDSYSGTCILRSFLAFLPVKEIYFYEDEVQVSLDHAVICKDELDGLISAVERNHKADIKQSVDAFYSKMREMKVSQETVKLNINYLLFSLIHLATKLNEDVDQRKILEIISEAAVEEGMMRGSSEHLFEFSRDYADYLSQLAKSLGKGVLDDILREIEENYADNLTLRSLGKKYYVNSVYLGQLFKNEFQSSFKDYLNSVRMKHAAELLTYSDMKIMEVAERVGYRDVNYFVTRFINTYDCTPSKFRRAKQKMDTIHNA